MERLILANPRGFCAGVERAILIVKRCLEIYGKPVYVRHQIVHNTHVIKDLESKGAIFIEDLDQIPNNAKAVIFSAHGTPPEVISKAKSKGLNLVDAVCPLVSKVHFEADRYFKEGYEIVLIGHAGHQEVIGTRGYAPMHLVQNVEDTKKLELKSEKKIYLTQTTLSVDDTKEIVKALKIKYPKINSPPKEDICYATTNRQEAVKKLAKQTELILVVGSKNSSNSNRLVETAKKEGINSELIEDESFIDLNKLSKAKNVGLTAGASAPEKLIQKIIEKIKSSFPETKIETLNITQENMTFPLPTELKRS